MLDYLKVISDSFPIAIMFIALCATVCALYAMNWFKKSDQEDKAYRAAQAREVAPVQRDRDYA